MMIKGSVLLLSALCLLVGCQREEAPSSLSSSTPPPTTLTAVAPTTPKAAVRTPHYHLNQDQEYVYQALNNPDQTIVVRYLGFLDGQHKVIINPTRQAHTTLTCDSKCSTIEAMSYYGDQLMATEKFTGPGSLEEIIMQDVKAGLLRAS